MATRAQWRRPTNWSEVVARSGGRNHLNSLRRLAMEERRKDSLKVLPRSGWPARGAVMMLARVFDVHPSTISRDLTELTQRKLLCATCGGQMTKEHARRRKFRVGPVR